MGNALAIHRLGGIEDAKKYAQALAGVSTLVGDTDGKPILKLDKRGGYWKFGEGDTELTAEDVIAVNPFSFMKGYNAFVDDGLATTVDGDPAEVLVSVTAPMPYKDDLPELEEVRAKRGKEARQPEWKTCLSVDMAVIEGPNKGAEFVYKPTSKGGLRMVRKLSEEVARRLVDGNELCVPVIELFSDEYEHKTYGWIYTPEHAIVDWDTMFEIGGADAPAPKAEKHPKKGEKDAKGRAVDTRKSSKAEPEDDGDTAQEEREEKRGGRREDDRETRRGRRDGDSDKVEETRGRGRRGRDEETAEKEPARGERRSARGREEEAEEKEPAREERGERRGRRSDDEANQRGDGPRGGRARSGGRTRH